MGLFDYIPLKIISHRNFYLLGLAVILSGLAWSNFLMSLGQFILLGNWILEFDFKRKWQELKNNRVLLVLFSLFLLHLIGFIWTSDFAYAQKDIITKLPLLSLPLIIGTTKRLNEKESRALLLIYVLSIFVISIFSLLKLLGYVGEPIIDKRKLSILISHIRYGLNIAMAVIIIFYYFKRYSTGVKVLLSIISCWLILCLFLYELTTGLVCLIAAGLSIVAIRVWSHRTKPVLKLTIVILAISLIAFGVQSVHKIKTDYYSILPLDFDQDDKKLKTPSGNRYYHILDTDLQVNGVYIWRFIQNDEVKREWNKRSSLDYNGNDNRNQPLGHTLFRYLSSKGLKKDSASLSQLTDEEIKAIENGIAHSYYLNHNRIQNRIHKIFYEYDNYTKNQVVNGFSLAMRLEYWKNSWQIVTQNPVFGVGTGDIKNEIALGYEQSNSVLEKKYRKRTHNQYLTFWASFGILGLLVFIFYLAYPLITIQSKNRRIYAVFLVIACLSFITEDTLETQAGVTFFALFNTLIVLGLPIKK